MSRIGNSPITVPNEVTVEITSGGKFGHQNVSVTGPKGTLSTPLRHGVNVKHEGETITLERSNETKTNKSLHGLYRSLLNNMVEGVTKGYSRELEIIGIGYRAESQGNNTVFSLGYSHPIVYTAPEGINISVEEQTKVKVEGANKQLVGEVAAKIRAFRKPEPYKGKGVRYKNEQVRRKSAKAGAKE